MPLQTSVVAMPSSPLVQRLTSPNLPATSARVTLANSNTNVGPNSVGSEHSTSLAARSSPASASKYANHGIRRGAREAASDAVFATLRPSLRDARGDSRKSRDALWAIHEFGWMSAARQ